MNEGPESKGNSRAAAKLEGPSRQSWSWEAVEDETEKFSPPWHGTTRRGAVGTLDRSCYTTLSSIWISTWRVLPEILKVSRQSLFGDERDERGTARSRLAQSQMWQSRLPHAPTSTARLLYPISLIPHLYINIACITFVVKRIAFHLFRIYLTDFEMIWWKH